MAYLIDQAVDSPTIDAIAEQLSKAASLENGKRTAAGLARKVKENQQAKSELATVQAAHQLLEQKLRKNKVFNAAAIPLRFAKIILSRYEPGMKYGAHIDDAFIRGARTDLSFTLFLNEPNEYEGGELLISRPDGDEEVKAPKGSLYLYPSQSIHQVKPVTQGVRLVAVGWVQSRIRMEEQREVLFDLACAIDELATDPAKAQLRLRLLRSRNSLLRLWGD